MSFRIAAVVLLASAPVMGPTPAAAIPTTELSTDPNLIPKLEQALDEMVSELLTPGASVPDWNSSGSLIQDQGTLTGTYLLVTDKDGERSVAIIGQSSTEDIVPSNWRLVGEAGRLALPAPRADIIVAQMDGPFFMVARSHSRRVGNAYCSTSSANVRIYEVPGAGIESELDAQEFNFLVAAAVRRLEQHEVCVRYDPITSGYRLRYFRPDGRSLPVLNEFEERAAIVSPASIEQLLVNPQ